MQTQPAQLFFIRVASSDLIGKQVSFNILRFFYLEVKAFDIDNLLLLLVIDK